MEKLVKELREREERAQLVGDENEAANLRVQIANVENLQMALPRPRRQARIFTFWPCMFQQGSMSYNGS